VRERLKNRARLLRATATRSWRRGRKEAACRTHNFFEGLTKSKTVLLNGEDHDVFGDGTVVIKSSPGHTPGHQSLFLKLANTGNVLLSGDLYHYPEEITDKKIPNFDTDREQTAKSREKIEDFVKQNHAQLWIQHDYTSGIKRKIAPAFYD
jgi:N-acyl homoserine lactone hydrolase